MCGFSGEVLNARAAARHTRIGPSGVAGPLWPIGNRGSESARTVRPHPRKSAYYAFFLFRISEPANFRGDSADAHGEIDRIECTIWQNCETVNFNPSEIDGGPLRSNLAIRWL